MPANEPKPPVGVGEPSTMLDEGAVAHYHQLAERLTAIGLLTVVDQTILEMHCQAYSDVVRLTKRIRAEGEVLTGINKNGDEYTYRNPLTTIIGERIKTLRDTARDMGLTPEARGKLSVNVAEAKPGDSVLAFINSAAG